MNSTLSKVYTHVTMNHVYYIYMVETTDIHEHEDGSEMVYYYWERSDRIKNVTFGPEYVAFLPLDTIAECLEDITWVETTGGKISEESINECMVSIQESLGIGQAKH